MVPVRLRLLTVLFVPLLAVSTSACSDDDLTPEEARYERVRERLVLSFSEPQVDCMMDQFSDSVLASLDVEGQLPQGADLEDYSEIATTCVVDGTPTTTGGDSEAPETTDDPATPPADPEADTDGGDGAEGDAGDAEGDAPATEPGEPTGATDDAPADDDSDAEGGDGEGEGDDGSGSGEPDAG